MKNIKLFLLVILSTFINQSNVFSSECFKLVPFGYNDHYVKLPSNFKFCVKKKNIKINYETGIYGERILKNNDNKDFINIFGDSHALGLDVNNTNDYFLSKVYPKKSFRIFAAPNNGPFEVLNFLEIHKDAFNNQNGVIVFNLSTDIFRINKKWDPRNFVALNDFQLEEIKYNKFKYHFYFIKNLIFNRKFTIARPNNIEMQELFNSNLNNIKFDFGNYLKDLTNLDYDNLDIIFILPYWIYQKNNVSKFEENKSITNKILDLVCKDVESLSNKFDILIQKNDLNLEEAFLTIDKRHFKSNLVNLTNFQNLC